MLGGTGEPHTLNGHTAGGKGVLWKTLPEASALHIGSQVARYLQQDANLLDLFIAVLSSHPPSTVWVLCPLVLLSYGAGFHSGNAPTSWATTARGFLASFLFPHSWSSTNMVTCRTAASKERSYYSGKLYSLPLELHCLLVVAGAQWLMPQYYKFNPIQGVKEHS